MLNNKVHVLITFFLLLGSVWAQQSREGNLADLIADIRDAMPGRDSYAYINPASSQRDSFALIIDAILDENYSSADSVASRLNYGLFEFTDTGDGNRIYYVLMEKNADKADSVKLGWGTYLFNPEGFNNVAIEIPHPMFDTNTWMLGISAYQNLDSQYFLMAGTHRYANGSNPAPADVAHNTDNIFYLVHSKIAPRSNHALQIHGYSRSTREEYATYPDVVISNGTSTPSAILDSLDSAIENQGYSSGVFDGQNYIYLGATTNTQGQFSNSNGYSFIHMELEYFIRSNQSERENIIDALHDVFMIETAIKPLPAMQSVTSFVLGWNYPNPFNPQTRIPFQLNYSQHIQVHIYNELGQRIITLIDKILETGAYELIWNGRDMNGNPVASGSYYYVMQNDNQVQAKSMVLIR